MMTQGNELDSLFKKYETEKKSKKAIEAYDDFPAFANYVYEYELYEKQKEIIDIVCDEGYGQILIEAPRGSGKSELVTIAYQSWVIGRDHDARIITCSNTLDQAKLFLAKISSTMINNLNYREVFGDLVPSGRDESQWTMDIKTVADRSDLKDPTMVALGRGGTIVGRRASLIICDDIIDTDAVLTEHQRMRVVKWFKEELFPCLLPTGRIIVIGTRYHEEDIYQELEQLWGEEND